MALNKIGVSNFLWKKTQNIGGNKKALSITKLTGLNFFRKIEDYSIINNRSTSLPFSECSTTK